MTVINCLIEVNVNNSLLGKHSQLPEDQTISSRCELRAKMKTNAPLEEPHKKKTNYVPISKTSNSLASSRSRSAPADSR